MFKSELVQTKHELKDNVLAFAAAVKAAPTMSAQEKRALANGCSHAVEWAAFPDGQGGWVVAFSKYAGYRHVTPAIYDRYRKTHMTGTDTKRRVEKFGGVAHAVWGASGKSSHPAVDAVHAICLALGKTPKLTAKVRVFPTDDRPAAMDVLVAALRAARFDDAELRALIAEVKKGA